MFYTRKSRPRVEQVENLLLPLPSGLIMHLLHLTAPKGVPAMFIRLLLQPGSCMEHKENSTYQHRSSPPSCDKISAFLVFMTKRGSYFTLFTVILLNIPRITDAKSLGLLTNEFIHYLTI